MHKIEWKQNQYARMHEYTATVYGGIGTATLITSLVGTRYKYTIMYKSAGSMSNSVIFVSRAKFNKDSVKDAAAVKVIRLLRVLEEE